MHQINARFQIRKHIESGNLPAATTLLNDINPRVPPPHLSLLTL